MLPHPHRNKQYGIFNPRFIGYLHNVKEKSKQCQSNVKVIPIMVSMNVFKTAVLKLLNVEGYLPPLQGLTLKFPHNFIKTVINRRSA